MVTRGNAARILASLLVFAAGLYAAPKAAAAFKNIQEGMEAPPFRLKDTAGGDVSLEAFKKDKAVIVVFWATWSDRSIAELKDVQKLFGEYGKQGLSAVAVNVDHEHMTAEDEKAVREKAAGLGIAFPVLFDPGLDIYRGYGVVAVPSTAILGGEGVIRNAFNGYPTSAHREMREVVEVLLGKKTKEEAAPAARVEKGHKPVRQALLQYNLARRLYASGMAEMAEPKIRTAIAADPEWAAPRILMGKILLARAAKDPRKMDEAVKAFQEAAAAEKENVVARTELARVYWLKGSAAEAEKEVDEALAGSSSYTPALLLKAAILAKKGNLPEAEKRMAEAFALNPRDPQSRALAGEAYEGAGELKKAAEMYRKAWELAGE